MSVKTYNAYLGSTKIAEGLTDPNHVYKGLAEDTQYLVTFTEVIDGIESDKAIPATARTLRAPVSLTYNLNGGSGNLPKQTARRGDTVTLHGTRPTRDNHRFDGWKTSIGAIVQPGATIKLTQDMTLTAEWMRLYTITYGLAGGVGSFPTQTVTADHNFKLPASTPTYPGNRFDGWLRSKDGKIYQPGAPIFDI